MKKVRIHIDYANLEVITEYLQIIKEAFELAGYDASFYRDYREVDRDMLLVIPSSLEAVKYYFRGYRNIILWQQGLGGEETYLRNHSLLRKFAWDVVEWFMLRRVRFIFFVSEEMRRYYEKKFKTTFARSYVMPCFNEAIDLNFDLADKYAHNTFTYVGSLARWQCFEKTLSIYKQIEEEVPDAKLLVYTFSVEKAKELMEKYGIQNYEVDCVPKEEVRRCMQPIKYGFVIRDDIHVNRVSTPTKLSSYMSSGVIPIFSECIKDFYENTKEMKYICAVREGKEVSEILEFMKKEIDPIEIKKEYEQLFGNYYSREKYICEIAKLEF